MRFKLAGFKPGTPTATIAAAGEAQTTPSFYWDRVEGAAGYTIQIDDDANLSSPFINKRIDGSSYTPQDTLADGTYYWRVAMRRSRDVVGQWSPIQSFTKRSLAPTLLQPIDNELVNQQPVFSWTPVITNSGDLRIAAPKYRLQWDDDPNFGSPKSVDTESSAYALTERESLSGWHLVLARRRHRRQASGRGLLRPGQLPQRISTAHAPNTGAEQQPGHQLRFCLDAARRGRRI